MTEEKKREESVAAIVANRNLLAAMSIMLKLMERMGEAREILVNQKPGWEIAYKNAIGTTFNYTMIDALHLKEAADKAIEHQKLID